MIVKGIGVSIQYFELSLIAGSLEWPDDEQSLGVSTGYSFLCLFCRI